MKCPFLNDCSSLDLERIKDFCFEDYALCKDYIACKQIIFVMEGRIVGERSESKI